LREQRESGEIMSREFERAGRLGRAFERVFERVFEREQNRESRESV
jgi:hypothetical protein